MTLTCNPILRLASQVVGRNRFFSGTSKNLTIGADDEFFCFTTVLLKLNEGNRFPIPMCQVVFGYNFLWFEAHLVGEHVFFWLPNSWDKGAPIETLLRSKLGDYLEEANLFGDQCSGCKKTVVSTPGKSTHGTLKKTEGFSTKIRIRWEGTRIRLELDVRWVGVAGWGKGPAQKISNRFQAIPSMTMVPSNDHGPVENEWKWS